jgi:hypothetical protein
MSAQETAERLDQVRMHLHAAVEELDGDNSDDARTMRGLLTRAQDALEKIRSRQGAAWANRLLEGKR